MEKQEKTVTRRIIIAPRGERVDQLKIYRIECPEGVAEIDVSALFHDPLTERIISEVPEGEFLEVMYHNGVVDPAQESIVLACQDLGLDVVAAKVSNRYYGAAREGVYRNKQVHAVYTEEPQLTTLRPRGVRNGMQKYDLTCMEDAELLALSDERHLSLSLEQMRELKSIQRDLGCTQVSDVFLETFGAKWSDHCAHTTWETFKLLQKLKSTTERIANPNALSVFVDNAGAWYFYEGTVLVFKLETHCSPSQSEPYAGQMTKPGGVLRDIFANGLGAKPIWLIEMTVVGEFLLKRYPDLAGQTLSAQTIAQETIRAIRDYGNPMGVPMALARMMSHPNFGGKVFALGGAVGITTMEAAKKGRPNVGDLLVLVGGKTGNDGLHGATVSSGRMSEIITSGDVSHEQIGNPYTEQKMMRAVVEVRDAGCATCINDGGAAGIVSGAGEMGEHCGPSGGLRINLACVPLKTDKLDNWRIALSESQERLFYAIKPDMLETAMGIFGKYELEATVIGIFTGNGRFEMHHDDSVTDFHLSQRASGEIALDVPYEYFDRCPLPDLPIVEPPPKPDVVFPKIGMDNIVEFTEGMLGHFDVADQSRATSQYDSTVQGKTWQGPLYGKGYDVHSHLAVSVPIYGKPYAATLSQSFLPGQFEVDPIIAARNAVLDAVVTQVVAGVRLGDIALADNFYTPDHDKHAYYYLNGQVDELCSIVMELGTPPITGKDSSHASAFFEAVKLLVNAPASVAITALGKAPDANRLVLHEWQGVGHAVYLLGTSAGRLDGSILASSLGLTGSCLGTMPVKGARKYMETLSECARDGMFWSAVPINRGGIMLRVFEGMQASGYGFRFLDDVPLRALFLERLGSVLVEIDAEAEKRLLSECGDMLQPRKVGVIRSRKEMMLRGEKMPWRQLKKAWKGGFAKEVMK